LFIAWQPFAFEAAEAAFVMIAEGFSPAAEDRRLREQSPVLSGYPALPPDRSRENRLHIQASTTTLEELL
jgi:hypothetical protein